MSQRTIEFSRVLSVSADAAFAWHDRPGAFQRLNPPWQPVEVVRQEGGIRDGAQVTVRVPAGPLRVRWDLEHRGWEQGRRFEDVQVSGPMRSWHHVHAFEPVEDATCRLRDTITFALPLAAVSHRLGVASLIERMLQRLFNYRHRVTEDDLVAHDRFRDASRQTVAISGAGGLIGSALASFLTTGGHTVRRLVRRPARAADEISWSVDDGISDPATLADVDAVVHLAGEGIAARRWTDAQMQRIRSSRVDGTRALCESIARAPNPPRTLIAASAIGVYGDRGDEPLTEDSDPGTGFLADVARDWEAAAEPALAAGVRVVHPRIGVVVTATGGALPKLLLPARLGASAQVGRGDQFMSWISLDDVITVLGVALLDERLAGPLNLTAPHPVTNRSFARTLARVLRRPAIGFLPAPLARAALGRMADDLLLGSARVLPRVLESHGYQFRDPDLETALRHTLGRLE